MQKSKSKNNSSKKIIPILAMALIVVGVILIVVLSNNKTEKKWQTKYNPGNVEVVVTDNAGGSQNSQPQETEGNNMVNNLGAATTGEINGGGSNAQQVYENTEELLEGKEIEVK